MTLKSVSAGRHSGQTAVTSAIYRRREAARPKIGYLPAVTPHFASGKAKCDRDKSVLAVSALSFVTVTAEEFEMIQYPHLFGGIETECHCSLADL